MTIVVISMIRDAWGGSEELWAAMAEEALKKGHRVLHVSYRFTPIHPKMQALINSGLVVYSRPSYRPSSGNSVLKLMGKAIFFVQKRANGAIWKVFEQKPDIILYNGTCYSITDEKNLLQYLQKSTAKFFILGHFNREDGADLPSAAVTTIIKAYDRCKKVLFITQRSILKARHFLNSAIPNAMVVRNPVNIHSTGIIPYPTSTTTQFAMVGNLVVVHKGQDIALEVLSTDVWKKRDWHVNIYGAGQDEEVLKKMVDFFGLKNYVTFHGRVNNIRQVWEANHALLMPSRMEGMPLAVVEAMLCGRPSIVTDVGGHTEWITDGTEGFIAPEPTVAFFGNALERAWLAKTGWENIGKKAHETAMRLYNPHAGETLLGLLAAE